MKNYKDYKYFENRPDVVKVWDDLEAYTIGADLNSAILTLQIFIVKILQTTVLI